VPTAGVCDCSDFKFVCDSVLVTITLFLLTVAQLGEHSSILLSWDFTARPSGKEQRPNGNVENKQYKLNL
jgi:hypothetical protein